MPKGKTNAPLNILVIDESLYDSEPMQALRKKGHIVERASGMVQTIGGYDRIYGSNCYRMSVELLSFLPISLKEARLEKKQRKESSK